MKARPLTPLVDESTTWGVVEWWRLEIRSFDDAPRVQHKLAPLGPKEAWSKEYGRPSLGGCLTLLVFAACLVLPAIAAAVMYAWWVGDPDARMMPLALAGWLVVASLVVEVHGAVVDARSPSARLRAADVKVALVHVVPEAVVLLIVLGAVRGGQFDAARDPSLWWLAPFVIDVGLHVWRLRRGTTVEGGPQNPIENVEWRVRDIDTATQQRILQDRNEAISRLQTQGKIDDDTARRALGTDLGRLALVMAPEGRSSSFPAGSEDDEER